MAIIIQPKAPLMSVSCLDLFLPYSHRRAANLAKLSLIKRLALTVSPVSSDFSKKTIELVWSATISRSWRPIITQRSDSVARFSWEGAMNQMLVRAKFVISERTPCLKPTLNTESARKIVLVFHIWLKTPLPSSLVETLKNAKALEDRPIHVADPTIQAGRSSI